MTFKVSKSAVQKVIDLFKIRIGGAWKDVAFARVWKVIDGVGAWKEFYTLGVGGSTPTPPPIIIVPPAPPAELTVTPGTYVEVSGERVGFGICYTNVVTLGVSGGTGPYTFSWSRTTSGSGSLSVNPANHAQCQFSKNLSAGGALPQIKYGDFQCIVQDSLGNSKTVNIHVKYYYYSFSEYNNEDLPEEW